MRKYSNRYTPEEGEAKLYWSARNTGPCAPEEMDTELYCPRCLSSFGLKVPAVFITEAKPGSALADVRCPVAGQTVHGGLSHAPVSWGVDATGQRWGFDVTTGEFLRIYSFRPGQWLRTRVESKVDRAMWAWRVLTASRPKPWHSDTVPAETCVLTPAEWDARFREAER